MRYIIYIFGLILATCYARNRVRLPTKCKQTGPCTCQSELGKIDLTPLASQSGRPAFRDIIDGSGRRYYAWNPCVPFTQDKCQNAALCVTDDNATSGTLLGTQSSALFIEDGRGALKLAYFNNERSITVGLQCSSSMDYLHVDHSGDLVLWSRHACWTNRPVLPSDPSVSNVTITMPTPGVVTMTSGPSDLQTVTLLLTIEVLATVLILIVVVTVLLAYLNRKLHYNRMSNSPPAYEQLSTKDDFMIQI